MEPTKKPESEPPTSIFEPRIEILTPKSPQYDPNLGPAKVVVLENKTEAEIDHMKNTVLEKETEEEIGKMFDESEPFSIYDLDKKEIDKPSDEKPHKLEKFDANDEKTDKFDENLDKYVEVKDQSQSFQEILHPDIPIETLDERISRYLDSKAKNETLSFEEKLAKCAEKVENSEKLPPFGESFKNVATQTFLTFNNNLDSQIPSTESASENIEMQEIPLTKENKADSIDEKMEIQETQLDKNKIFEIPVIKDEIKIKIESPKPMAGQLIDEETIEKTIAQIQESPQELESQATTAALNLMTTEIMQDSDDDESTLSGNESH
ncbi:unnamed protein product [Allacma fusca]|uniref:Uncharacterized protein n=1 Tax=Allacma fusca TaxID=39272 RepID=A0A8J2P7Q5_9HEXA|nr:unnamed protein product [Allacma fusca]